MCLPPLMYHAADNEILSFFADVGRRESAATDDLQQPVQQPERSEPGDHRSAVRVETVVAVKECSGDARRIPAILGLTGGDMQVLVGGDDWALEGACAGAVGWVSGVANVAPVECLEMWRACTAGDLEVANRLYQRMLPLARLDMHPKLVQFFKAAQDRVGRVGGPTRSPRLALTAEEEHMLEEAMEALRPASVA